MTTIIFNGIKVDRQKSLYHPYQPTVAQLVTCKVYTDVGGIEYKCSSAMLFHLYVR